MDQNSEIKRLLPHFHAEDYCLESEEPAELQRLVAELIHDYEPVSIGEVTTVQRVALTQWMALRTARLCAGVLQARADSRVDLEDSRREHDGEEPLGAPASHSAACTALLGRAFISDCGDNRALTLAARLAAHADVEYHRCLNRLDRLRDRRRARRQIPSATPKPAASEIPAVFTAA